MRVLLILAALAAPALAQELPTAEEPLSGQLPSEPIHRETMPGALERADRKMEWWNRGTFIRSQNFGTNGRKNATDQASENADFPRDAHEGAGPWNRW